MPIVNGLGELNEAGHTIDDLGNVQVDFVWGNFPLQPNDDRNGDDLDYSLDNHVIADIGWSNFPGYIPNYAGDEDAALEAVVPAYRGLQWEAVQAALMERGLGNTVQWISPVVTAISTTGKTATITLDDVYGFAAGDIISGYYDDNDGISGTFTDAKITAVNGTELTATLKTAISPALDIATAVNSQLFVNYVPNNDTRYVLSSNKEEGEIVDINSTVIIRVLVNND